MSKTFVLVFVFANLCAAQPRISRVANGYSYVPAGLPNSGIAQGSIFAIFGEGLATSSSGLQNTPLPTSLDGVRVDITVNGNTSRAILYYVTPTQIGALLPSATPAGDGQIVVTSNGVSSAPAPIQVVKTAFGILTLDQSGIGPAASFDAKGRPLGMANSAAAGDNITIWGSGLGPVGGDEAIPQTPANLEIPIAVEIGGVAASVTYHGRSVYPGLDQINLIVPPGVSQGCYVSIVVGSGGIVSNFATIPFSTSGNFCTDKHTGIDGRWITGREKFTIGEIEMGLESPFEHPDFGDGSLQATFARYSAAQFAVRSPGKNPSLGSCLVYSFRGSEPSLASPIQPDPLNGGDSISFNGLSVPFQKGSYTLNVGFSIMGATAYPIKNGAGGPDVGPFAAYVAVAGSAGNGDRLGGGAGISTWISGGITSVDRSQPLKLTWAQSRNGGANGDNFVQISGSSVAAAGESSAGAVFYCTAANFGSFTIPQAVLMALPASTPGNASKLSLATYGDYTAFASTLHVPGIDLPMASGFAKSTLSVNYR